jgi:hypothetical protein
MFILPSLGSVNLAKKCDFVKSYAILEQNIYMPERAYKPEQESSDHRYQTELQDEKSLRPLEPEAEHKSAIVEKTARTLNNPSLPIDDFQETPTGFNALKYSSDNERDEQADHAVLNRRGEFTADIDRRDAGVQRRKVERPPSQEATGQLPGRQDRRAAKPAPETPINQLRKNITELTGLIEASPKGDETTAVFLARLNQERQKLGALLMRDYNEENPNDTRTAPTKRDLTAKSFETKLPTGSPTIKEHKPFNTTPMTPEQQIAWTKEQQNKLQVGGFQEDVKYEQFVKSRNKKLAESIGKEDAAWFNNDTRETYQDRAKSEKKPASAGFFSRLKNLFRS